MHLRLTNVAVALVLGCANLAALAETPASIMAAYAAQSGQSPQSAKGETFFKAKHGQEWQCTTCHGATPTATGRHASTNMAIDPLAPAANPKRLTDSAKVEKWFRRNCKDVLARECTATEKADVMAYLIQLK